MQPFVTVRALVVNPAGELLLIRRSVTDTLSPGSWDIPGGQVDANEAIETSLVREVSEEVGIPITHPKLVYGVSAPRTSGTGTWLFFVVHVPTDATVAIGDEHDAFQWVPFAELPNYTDYEILLGMHRFVSEHTLLATT